MTISFIDPRTALIVIDLQNGLAALPFADLFDDVVAQAARLAKACRAQALPVVLVNNDGGAPGRREQAPAIPQTVGWTNLVPNLRAESSDHRVTKRSPGAFTATGLDTWLRDRQVTQVIVAGVATGTGVEMTARQAYELGMNVTLAIDAMTDFDPVVHANCIERVFKRFGETGSTSDLIDRIGNGRAPR